MIESPKLAADKLKSLIQKMDQAKFTIQLNTLKKMCEQWIKEIKDSLENGKLNSLDLAKHLDFSFQNKDLPLGDQSKSPKDHNDIIVDQLTLEINQQYFKSKMSLQSMGPNAHEKIQEEKDKFYHEKFKAALRSVRTDAVLGGDTYGPDYEKLGNYSISKGNISRMRSIQTEGYHPESKISQILEKNAQAKAARCGNCNELSYLITEYLWKYPHGIERIEVVSSSGSGNESFDHVFCLINRAPGSSLDDPSTWGDQTYLVDPWSSQFFKINDYTKDMRELLRQGHESSKLLPRYQDPWYLANVPVNDISLELASNLDLNPHEIPYSSEYSHLIKSHDINFDKGPYQVDEFSSWIVGIEEAQKNLKAAHKSEFQATLSVLKKQTLTPSTPEKNPQIKHYESIEHAILEGDIRTLKSLHPDFSQPIVIPKQYNSKTKTWENITMPLVQLVIQLSANHQPNTLKLAQEVIHHQSGWDINETFPDGSTALCLAVNFQNKGLVDFLLEKGADPQHALKLDDNSSASPLYLAAEQGDIEIFKSIFSANSEQLETPKVNGMTPLHIAVENGHYDIAEFLIQKGANLDSKASLGKTPVWSAAKSGNLKMIQLLIRHGAKLDEIGPNSTTPFFVAAATGNLDIVKELSKPKYNVNVNFQNSQFENYTPLLIAITNGYIDVVNYLIEHPKVDVNLATQNSNVNPLFGCVRRGWKTLFEKCLKKGADPNQPILNSNENLLSLLIGQYKNELAEILIRHKADINLVHTDEQLSPLQVALKAGSSFANTLIKLGADTDYVTQNKESCLILACQADVPDLKSIQTLIDKGADVNQQVNSTSPLKAAFSNYQIPLLKCLLKNNADPLQVYFDSGRNLILEAISQGRANELKIMLEHLKRQGAQLTKILNLATGNFTALEIACQQGHIECAQHLLTFGAQPKHSSALFLAITSQNKALVKLMLQNGAPLHKKNKDGQLPLTYALTNGDAHTVKYLIKCYHTSQKHGDIPKKWRDPLSGDNILHACIEHFNSPQDLILVFEQLPDLLMVPNKAGQTPLQLLSKKFEDQPIPLKLIAHSFIYSQLTEHKDSYISNAINFIRHSKDFDLLLEWVQDPNWTRLFSLENIQKLSQCVQEAFPKGPVNDLSEQLFTTIKQVQTHKVSNDKDKQPIETDPSRVKNTSARKHRL